eukprot:TRINITY_DN101434_c0_g1_i1.p1 TRINITY_DN101434_c0_g1~~TRINITY_DN101434_c0_g1_i1.p1  ORF type:complete len:322 (-),score=108.48 TRINITY_DN101434_c0_g1_i1:257-1222(-)
MSKLSFDYSKWDRLELSDDEDTHHPNLDKNLNIRVNRITRDRKEEEIDDAKAKAEASGDMDKAAKLENKRPLHVGNLCKVTDERTIINHSDGRTDRRGGGEEFSVDEYVEFKKSHEKLLKEFVDADWEKSRQMLFKEGEILLDDHANNYYLLATLDEEMKGNEPMVQKLARQGQIVSQIHQLAKPMNRPPRDLVHRFFDRFDSGEARGAFQEGVDHFLKQIKARAVQKRKEEAEAAAAEEEEEVEAKPLVEAMYEMSKEERMGPGGLDPVEIFESLPVGMQECFRSGDIDALKKLASEMDPAEFENHFKRCIDAGLWRTAS